MASVVCAKKGSITADDGSGISVMSDSLIAFQPAMDEPSNIKPWVNASSSISDRSKVTCCHLPLGSVKRRSTNLTSLSLIIFRTDFASAAMGSSLSLVKRLEMDGDSRRQIASDPFSPVRIRTASSTSSTKIFPSPIRPVRAAFRIASSAASTCSGMRTISIFTLGRKSTTYSADR